MRQIGRYVLHEEIASGGMATVHLGRVIGDEGFRRTVAIKRLHPHIASSPGALEMFIDEARLSARVRHRNTVATLDVVREDRELFLVMEYVQGVELSVLENRAKQSGSSIPLPIVSALMLDTLAGLEAVHTTTDELGRPLSIVHRDVSPQNILVGSDGSARVLDFGIAKAAVRLQTTREDQLKGKLRFMAPEQFLDEEVDGRTDQFAAGAVLWGLLTNERLFAATNEAGVIAKVLEGVILPPSHHRPEVPPALDALVARALRRTRNERFRTCLDMAAALREAVPPAPPEEVRAWLEAEAGDTLRARAERVARMEAGLLSSPDGRSALLLAPEAATKTETAIAPTMTAPVHAVETSVPHRARRVFALAAVIAVLLVGTTAIVVSAFVRGPPSQAASNTARAPESGAATGEAPPPIVVASATHVAPSTVPARAGRPPQRPSAHPVSRASCAQLYTVDADGIKRVKPECL